MRRFQRYESDVRTAIDAVLLGRDIILGPSVERFEAAFAEECGASHAVGVASGTDAIRLTLQAFGVGPGEEVLVPALTAPATAMAVVLAGATPVYADVDPMTRSIDPNAVASLIGPKTSAIVAVHLYGVPAPIGALRDLASRHGLLLIEDCAQAHGASTDGRPVGSFGQASAFSFYPTKNLGCLGDGGAVVTDDREIARKLKALRNYGWSSPDRICEMTAGPSRLDELQAAVLLAMLPHLQSGNSERRRIAQAYRERTAGYVALPHDVPGSVWHQFVIEVDDRESVREGLAAVGIGTAVHYDPPLHLHPALTPLRATPLCRTEKLCKRVLSLPIQPEVVDDQVDVIADALLKVLERA